jgi:hypothetical protein
MPTFLSDPPPVALVVFGVLVLILGGLAARYRKKPLLAAFTGLVLLFVAWLVVALLTESPREEAVRRVTAMAAAVEKKDWAAFGEHISDSFQKDKLKKADVKGYFDHGTALNLRAAVWDFALTDPPRVTDAEVVIAFEARASPPSGEPFLRRIEATFVKDPDGKFRLKTYETFLPGTRTKAGIP